MVERGLVDDLADRDVKAARSTIDEELKRWENAGYAGRTGGGRRGSPYRFWMVSKPPTSFLRWVERLQRRKRRRRGSVDRMRPLTDPRTGEARQWTPHVRETNRTVAPLVMPHLLAGSPYGLQVQRRTKI